MRKVIVQVILIFVHVVSFYAYADTTKTDIHRDGRNIQRDGFLLEWNTDDSRVFAQGSSVRWDAINTPEGFAGYVRYPYTPDRCSVRTFAFHKQPADSALLRMDVHYPGPQDAYYNVHLDTEKGDSIIAAEWLIPWSIIKPDSSGAFQLSVSSQDTCRGQNTLVIDGKTGLLKNKGTPEAVPPLRLIFQGFLILVLLIAYLLVRSKAKKLKKKQ
ncbi:MAG: hypothetical protein ACOCW2_01985 [Chitinivibrionales bacterium]